jgi:hypothetical protein
VVRSRADRLAPDDEAVRTVEDWILGMSPQASRAENLRLATREIFSSNKELAHKFEQLERKQQEQGEQITAIIETINQLLLPQPVAEKRQIGLKPDKE